MFLFLGSTLGMFGWCVSGIFFSLKFSSVKRVKKKRIYCILRYRNIV